MFESKRKYTQAVLFVVGILLLAGLIFYRLLGSDNVLFSTDNNIGSETVFRNAFPHAFRAYWADGVFAGIQGGGVLCWTTLLLYLLPITVYFNWIHAIDLCIASLFFGWFLRMRRVSWSGCFVGAVTAFWVGSNLTLTYAGHTSKFAIVMLAPVGLWSVEHLVHRLHPAWGMLAGGVLGAMFLEQQDVALFFAFPLFAYFIYAFIREQGMAWRKLIAMSFVVGVAALLVAGRALIGGYQTNVTGMSAGGGESSQAKWEFCTQWSVPPDESIEIIAPGYMGWRSGEPAGPYWGRTGQSAEWPRTGQGFPNFRLENIYLGIIPVAFALLACLMAWRRILAADTVGEKAWRMDVRFWSVAALVVLLLSFGKYFPLYSLFYHLPVVNNIRNPNKFIQVFQIGAGILAAYGFDRIFGGKNSACKQDAA
jgi:hypothetical protein